MTITPNGFLHAIREVPDDDTPRLVYADWLDENGDHARAEFIRIQIELASSDLDVDRALTLRRREKSLRETHGAAWQQPFRAEHKPHFTRGFVSALTLSAAELLERGREYLSAAPITSITLSEDREDAELTANLSRCEFLRNLQALDLYSSPIGEEAARVLFGSPYLRGLRELHLGEGDATPDMIPILAECFSGLRALYLWDFYQGELGDAGLTALANSPAFASLTNLNLLQTGVRADGARAVAGSPYLRHLESLSFGFQACGYAPNFIGPEGIGHLARSPQLAGLRHLGLGLTSAGSAGVRELAKSHHLHRLQSLNLGLNEIGDDGVAALAEWPSLGSVAWLDLSSNNIGSEGVTALAKSPYTTKLETLGLVLRETGAKGLRALAESPHLNRLRTLWLLGYGLNANEVAILLGDNRFAQLAELHVGGVKEPQRAQLKARFGDRVQC